MTRGRDQSDVSELNGACCSESEQVAAEEVVTKVSQSLVREERSDFEHVAFRHLFSGVVHLAKCEGPDFDGEIQVLKCGRPVSANYAKLEVVPLCDVRQCSTCWA